MQHKQVPQQHTIMHLVCAGDNLVYSKTVSDPVKFIQSYFNKVGFMSASINNMKWQVTHKTSVVPVYEHF